MCDHAILVHVSTAYVSGAVVGDIPETLYHKDTSGKERFPLRGISDIDLEIEARAIYRIRSGLKG